MNHLFAVNIVDLSGASKTLSSHDDATLSGHDDGLLRLFSLDLLGFRFGDNFNVARMRQERVDTAMSTIRTATLLWCLVDLDVLQNERIDFQSFRLNQLRQRTVKTKMI